MCSFFWTPPPPLSALETEIEKLFFSLHIHQGNKPYGFLYEVRILYETIFYTFFFATSTHLEVFERQFITVSHYLGIQRIYLYTDILATHELVAIHVGHSFYI